jgi:succinate-semialdehyde dehydrogenase/glutarate-semialdehyde dehydrogenase
MKLGYFPLYLNGELKDGLAGKRHQVVFPITGEIVAEVAKADETDAQQALSAAKNAFQKWRKVPVSERIQWMEKLRDAAKDEKQALVEALHHETGKTIQEAEDEFKVLIQYIEFYASVIEKQQPTPVKNIKTPEAGAEIPSSHELRYQPLGVVVSYLPWNFPLDTLGFPLSCALASGCCVIIKPAPQSPLTAYVMGRICQKIGLPAGVVQFLYGDNDVLPPALSGSKIPALLTAVGSTATGLRVTEQGSTSIKRHCFELGGNAPFIVFDDASLDLAQGIIGMLKVIMAGQICVAMNRIFVHKSIAAEFEGRLTKSMSDINLKENPAIAPLISEAARQRVHDWVKEAIESGAELVMGGDLSLVPENGFYYPPTILKGVTPKMQIFKGEIFGPIITLIDFENDEEVLEMANDTDAGLTAFLFTGNNERIDRFTHELEFGEIMVNTASWGPHLPHIGIKQSGIGYVGGPEALKQFQTVKRVSTGDLKSMGM